MGSLAKLADGFSAGPRGIDGRTSVGGSGLSRGNVTSHLFVLTLADAVRDGVGGAVAKADDTLDPGKVAVGLVSVAVGGEGIDGGAVGASREDVASDAADVGLGDDEAGGTALKSVVLGSLHDSVGAVLTNNDDIVEVEGGGARSRSGYSSANEAGSDFGLSLSDVRKTASASVKPLAHAHDSPWHPRGSAHARARQAEGVGMDIVAKNPYGAAGMTTMTPERGDRASRSGLDRPSDSTTMR
ncbi:hypothetical protein CTAM01_16106 [Colletotrichum tamarilloi]|uniref:Uncharacterized protein n=1 Tax=Colletotrichum tamarilloi TaxID=1209934 RepID=A0ABQ9QJG7_9PEZI|nr:uncharacterized protein CTAM01_16106 [Colletotrichum tamarilloi]KAK1473325.1 hypothetical protein CTAM01_16106 [Colletotrichum tamarilloi]